MGAERAVLWSICVVITMYLVVVLIHYGVVIQVKNDFDFACVNSFWRCEQNSGLSDEDKLLLVTRLKKRGFYNVVITAPKTMSRGDISLFQVSAKKDVIYGKNLFKKSMESQEFIYKNKIMCRKVVN